MEVHITRGETMHVRYVPRTFSLKDLSDLILQVRILSWSASTEGTTSLGIVYLTATPGTSGIRRIVPTSCSRGGEGEGVRSAAQKAVAVHDGSL